MTVANFSVLCAAGLAGWRTCAAARRAVAAELVVAADPGPLMTKAWRRDGSSAELDCLRTVREQYTDRFTIATTPRLAHADPGED
jgi:hypothetical protein